MSRKVLLILTMVVVGICLAAMAETSSRNCVRVDAAQQIGSIDPARHSTLWTELVALLNLYDALYYPGENGQLQPQIAESYELSEDALTYTFALKKGIKFHDGTEVTAEDVAYSLERQLAIGEGISWMWNAVEDVTVIDKYHVAIQLSAPGAEFMLSIPYMYVMNKDLLEEHSVDSDHGQEWLLENDAGSGPYMLKLWERGSKFVMEKFDDYSFGWPENPVEEVQIIILRSPATVFTMMKTGDLNMTSEWLPCEILSKLRETEGIKMADQPSSNTFVLTMNCLREPTDDIHIRKALAWAFDYKACLTVIAPGAPQLRGPVPDLTPGHSDNLFQYSRDPLKAEQELKLSKYYPDIPPIELAYWQGVEEERRMALMLQATMSALGVEVNVHPEIGARFSEFAKTPEVTPNIVILSIGAVRPTAHSYLTDLYGSAMAGQWCGTSWFHTDEIDRLLEESQRTLDDTERMAMYHEIQETVVNACATIFAYVKPLNIAMAEEISGLRYRGYVHAAYYFNEMWFEE